MNEPKKDRLKDFIEENRMSFDTETPPVMDFSHLGAKEKEPKMIPLFWLYRVAAIFIVLLSVGAFWVFNHSGGESIAEHINVEKDHSEQEQVDFSLSQLSSEMAELESYYNLQLTEKKKTINELGYGDEIADEMLILDEEFNALKEELGENVDNHLIVNEMIKNYKLKLDLLESVLSDLQENYEDKNLTKLDQDDKTTYTVYY